MNKVLLFICMFGFSMSACADNAYDLKNIHQYCRQDFYASDLAKKLEINKSDLNHYYDYKDRKKLKLATVILNPQNNKTVQSIHLKWHKDAGLSAADIASEIGMDLPFTEKERYQVKTSGNKSILNFAGLNENVMELKIECAVNDLSSCWAISFICGEYVHD